MNGGSLVLSLERSSTGGGGGANHPQAQTISPIMTQSVGQPIAAIPAGQQQQLPATFDVINQQPLKCSSRDYGTVGGVVRRSSATSGNV